MIALSTLAGVGPGEGVEGVVEMLPVAEGRADCGQVQIPIVALPELLGVGPLSPLDMAVELGGAWRQDGAKLFGAIPADLATTGRTSACTFSKRLDASGRRLPFQRDMISA